MTDNERFKITESDCDEVVEEDGRRLGIQIFGVDNTVFGAAYEVFDLDAPFADQLVAEGNAASRSTALQYARQHATSLARRT